MCEIALAFSPRGRSAVTNVRLTDKSRRQIEG